MISFSCPKDHLMDGLRPYKLRANLIDSPERFVALMRPETVEVPATSNMKGLDASLRIG